MRVDLGDRAFRVVAVAFAAGAALLLASLANFLSYNDYPYFRPEVGLFIVGLLGLSAAMGFFYYPQRQWGRSFLEGLLAALFVDLNTDSIPLVAAAGIGVGTITLWRRTSMLGPMSVLGSVIFLTTLAGIGGRSSWIETVKGANPGTSAASNKPAIFHIVLDEHIGLEGLGYEGQAGHRLRDELKHFYLRSGFAVYGGAYSQHYHTVSSIPQILNYGEKLGQSAGRRGVIAGPTMHLQALVDQGYRLKIFQSDFADFCTGAKFDKCVTYESSGLRPTLKVPMTVPTRAAMIGLKLFAMAEIFECVSRGWNVGASLLRKRGLSVPTYKVNVAYSSTVGALESLNELSSLLRTAQPGDAYFVHLLLPHFPYVVQSDCSYLPWAAWDGLESDSTIAVRRRAYYAQVRCTMRKIQSLVKAISSSSARENAVIIIHGDHGSRIIRVAPNDNNFGRIGDTDMIAGFSTLFAIRAPGVKPFYAVERQPVAALLHDFSALGFHAAPQSKPPPHHIVYLTDSDWKPVRRVPLPESWTKGFDRPDTGH